MSPNNNQQQGTPLQFDPDFNGPQKRHSCTDVICLLLFIAFLVVWAGIGFYAYKNGDSNKLFVPTDSHGRRCGQDSDVLDKKYLFFFDLTKCATPNVLLNGCNTPQVCVKSCPDDPWLAILQIQGSFVASEVQKHLICTDDRIIPTVTSKERLQQVIDAGSCASWYITTHPVGGRCIPNSIANETALPPVLFRLLRAGLLEYSITIRNWLNHFTESENLQEVGEFVLQDLIVIWRYLVIALIVAMLASLAYIVLLRWLSGVMVWFSLLAIVVALGAGTYVSYVKYTELKKAGPQPDHPGFTLKEHFKSFFEMSETWFVLMLLSGSLFVIVSLLIIFLRKRISIAITLIGEGSKAVGSVVSALFFPIVPWLLQCVVIVWAIVIAVYLMSIGNPTFKLVGLDNNTECICDNGYKNDGQACDVNDFIQHCHKPRTHDPCVSAGCHFFSHESNNTVTCFQLVNLFGMFWGLAFISGLAEMILAATFATWYWTFKKRNLPFFTVTEAIARTLRYHLGTIAFGSLIIAICSFIRAMIEFAEMKLKKYDNAITRAIFCCLRCFFWCLDKFLRFVNRNAYIMCAIHGRNFCMSAKDAFELLMRNVIRVVVLDKVTDFLFFVGKVLLTVVMMTAAFFTFNRPVRLLDNSGQDVELHYYWLPMVVIGAFTYIIASIFFKVYAMAVDTLFLCFLEDCERNDGSEEKPYYMSKELMKILGKKNKKREK